MIGSDHWIADRPSMQEFDKQIPICGKIISNKIFQTNDSSVSMTVFVFLLAVSIFPPRSDASGNRLGRNEVNVKDK